MRNAMRVLLLGAVVGIMWSNAGVLAAPPPQRSFSASKFMLELDGQQVGFVSAAEGGLPFGEVVKIPGEEFFFKKHISHPRFSEIHLEVGAGMSSAFWDWISESLSGNHLRRNGAILAADFQGEVKSRLEFRQALITEVTFPALDASGKDPARLSIVLSPAETTLRKGSDTLSFSLGKNQKQWLTSNFRLTLDGVNTAKVSKIDAFTIKLADSGGNDDECRFCEEPLPAKIDFPNLVVTVAEPAEQFHEWFDDFVIQGNADDSKEKNGTLELLTPDLQSSLFTVTFKHVGIFSLVPEQNDANGASIARVVAQMYCEVMEFQAQ